MGMAALLLLFVWSAASALASSSDLAFASDPGRYLVLALRDLPLGQRLLAMAHLHSIVQGTGRTLLVAWPRTGRCRSSSRDLFSSSSPDLQLLDTDLLQGQAGLRLIEEAARSQAKSFLLVDQAALGRDALLSFPQDVLVTEYLHVDLLDPMAPASNSCVDYLWKVSRTLSFNLQPQSSAIEIVDNLFRTYFERSLPVAVFVSKGGLRDVDAYITFLHNLRSWYEKQQLRYKVRFLLVSSSAEVREKMTSSPSLGDSVLTLGSTNGDTDVYVQLVQWWAMRACALVLHNHGPAYPSDAPVSIDDHGNIVSNDGDTSSYVQDDWEVSLAQAAGIAGQVPLLSMYHADSSANIQLLMYGHHSLPDCGLGTYTPAGSSSCTNGTDIDNSHYYYHGSHCYKLEDSSLLSGFGIQNVNRISIKCRI
jgi:hypothetical protein